MMNGIDRKHVKGSYRLLRAGFGRGFVVFIFLFPPPWWSVARLTDTNLDLIPCARDQDHALRGERSGYGAWRHGETGKPVEKSEQNE